MNTEGRVHSLQLMPDGSMEVVMRYHSGMMYACSPPRPVPDTVVKHIYRAVEGRIVLADAIEGTHKPASYSAEGIAF